MASKYGEVIKGLSRSLGSDPKFQEVVDARKAELEKLYTGQPAALAAAYKAARAAKEDHEAQAAPLNVELAAVEQLMWRAYEDADVSSIKVGDKVIAVQSEPYASVTDPAELRAWAVENGHEGSLSLPWQTTNALAKAALLGEGTMPRGVEVTARTKTVMRKA